MNVCRSLQERCAEDWQKNFPFPWNVNRSGIISDGYESGDFLLTMEQEKILDLLTGKNLYQDSGVFVRELLQNAVDATLLRDRMDRDFSAESEEARIDLWEWSDKNGKLWFRIDDRGTGMTKGMLQRYFLKVGNSYYTSDELKQDLKTRRAQEYQGISRFGIGFLSCFLCGESAEVSTLYFAEEKNKREEKPASHRAASYGLRLNVTGLFGYYTLLNQASNHSADALLRPEKAKERKLLDALKLERDGYREKAGTSILICLNPGELGAVNLREEAQKWIGATRMPIYYNGERIGHTRKELMDTAERYKGENVIQLTDEQKQEFDKRFPRMKGNYPRFALKALSLDMPEYHPLDDLSGVVLKSEVRYDREPEWEEDGETYSLKTTWTPLNGAPEKAVIALRIGRSWDIKLQSDSFRIIDMSKSFSFPYCYNGIASRSFLSGGNSENDYKLFLLENRWRATVDAGRTRISALPLEALLAVSAITEDTASTCDILSYQFPLKQWREIRGTPLGDWIQRRFQSRKDEYCRDVRTLRGDMLPQKRTDEFSGNTRQMLAQYFAVCFQDDYQLTAEYDGAGESVSLKAKPNGAPESDYDLFPPLLFARAKDKDNRRFLRAYYRKSSDYRFSGVVNADHPYAVWLLGSAEILRKYFQRQFQRIADSLYSSDSPDFVIETANDVRNQPPNFKERRGIDIPPTLSAHDFWLDDEDF